MSEASTTWAVVPHEGIGPLPLGGAAEDFGATLASLPGNTGPLPTRPRSGQFDSGLTVFYELDQEGRVESVEVWRPSRDEPQAFLDGQGLFGVHGDTLSETLRARSVAVLPGGGTAIVRGADVGLTIEEGVVVAVLVGVAGYYDFLGSI